MAPQLGDRQGASGGRAGSRPSRRADAGGARAPRNAPVAMMSPQEREFRAKLKELRDHLTKNSDNVGPEIPRRGAQDALRRDRASLDLRRGVADEAKALHEEGIEFHPLPILPDERN